MGKSPSAQERLLAEALTLSVEERIALVEKITASLPAEVFAPELTDEMKAELDRRVKDFEDNPGDEYGWEEVKASLPHRK
jgi:putative addiction module component (TIGR02574 family)